MKNKTEREDGESSGERGVVSIEAALIFPLFLLVMLFAAQMVLVLFAERSASAIAEHAADASALEDGSVSDGQKAAKDATAQLAGIKNVNTQIQVTAENVTVDVTAQPLRVLPIDIEITAQAVSPLERTYTREQRK